MYAIGVALFVASIWRLRRQLLTAKAAYLARARRIVAEAYAPVTRHWAMGTAVAQSTQIAAAEALERRVAAIQEWPFDEGALRTMAAVATSVTAAILARLILSRFGL